MEELVRDINSSMPSIHLHLKHMHSSISGKVVGFSVFFFLVAMKGVNKIQKNEKSFLNYSTAEG